MGAVTADTVVVEMFAKLGRYKAEVLEADKVTNRSMEHIGGAAEKAERRVKASSAAIAASLKGAAAGIAASFGASKVQELADGYTRFTNQLKVAGQEGENLGKTQEALFAIAQKYGVALESVGTLYGRNAASAKELNLAQADQLKLVEGTAAALKVSGVSAEAASGALLQLSQVLGGTNVQAEEYNSLLDGARPLLQAVANGSDRFGGSVANLTAAVKNGKVSVKEFVDAGLVGIPALIAQAEKANLTIAGSLTVLNNALGRYVGQADDSLSATARVSTGIKALADNLDTVIPAIGIISAALVGRYVAGMVAAEGATLAATIAARGFGATLLGALGGPVGLAVAALAAGLTALAFAQRDVAVASQAVGSTSKQTASAIETLNHILDQDPSKSVAAGARDLAKARLEQANATYTAAKAEIALRQSQAQARLKDLEDGTVLEKTGAHGTYRQRKLSTFGTRAGTELERERGAAAKAISDAAADAVALDAAFKGSLKAIATGRSSSRPSGISTPVRTGATGGAAARPETQAELFAQVQADAARIREEALTAALKRATVSASSVDGDFTPAGQASGAASDQLRRAQEEIYDATYSSIANGLEAGFRGGLPGVLQFFSQELQRSLISSLAKSLADVVDHTGPGGKGGTFLTAAKAAMAIFGRANGGNVVGGGLHLVGEKGPELFRAPQSGSIVPTSKLSASRSVTHVSPTLNMTVDLKGANGDAVIVRIAREAAAQAGQQAYKQAIRDAPGAVSRYQQQRG